MFIRIEASSGVSITRQIMDQIRIACASGQIAPGDRLPSVRALAKDLAVNQNTILRVYERLTDEGLLERRHGDGTFLTCTLSAGQLAAQHSLIRDEAERIVRRASALSIDAPTVHKLIDQAFEDYRAARLPKEGKSNG